MRDVAADIATILEASTTLSLTPGTDLFAGPFPVQSKGTLVGVMPLTGTGEPYADARGDLWTVDAEVTVRGEPHAYKATLDLALAVFGVLHRARAEPYVSILCEDAVPEWDGYDEQNRPVFTITLTVRYVTTRASEALVVLPSEGLLRVDGVEFQDGSTLTSAPPPVDLTGYVTLTGTQTLANKTLASPVVTGPLMPATAGQQALGSAAVPWGPVHASAPANADAFSVGFGSYLNLGHAASRIRALDGNGAYTSGSWTVQREVIAYMGVRITAVSGHATPGPVVQHNVGAGTAAIPAGQTSVAITSNLVTSAKLAHITPMQIDSAVKAWAFSCTTGTLTVSIDAPCTAPWAFFWTLLA